MPKLSSTIHLGPIKVVLTGATTVDEMRKATTLIAKDLKEVAEDAADEVLPAVRRTVKKLKGGKPVRKKKKRGSR